MTNKNIIKPYQSKAGPIIAFLGVLVLLIGDLFLYNQLLYVDALLVSAGETWNSLGIDPTLLYVAIGITLFLGLGALCGVIISFKNPLIGGAICILFGMIALIGMFIPIGNIDLRSISMGIITVPMVAQGFFIQQFLIVIGGALCYILYTKLKTDEEVNAILTMRYPSYSKTQ